MRYQNQTFNVTPQCSPILWHLLIAFLLCLGLSGTAFGADGDDLAKQADNLLRSAERSMHKGDIDQAAVLLVEANDKIAELNALAGDHRKLKTLERKSAKLQKSIDKKSVGNDTKSSRAPPDIKKSGSAGLTGGVKKRLKDINKQLDSAEKYATSDAKQARYKLSKAAELFAEIDSMYAGKFDPEHPDYVQTRNRYENLTGSADTQAQAETQAIASAETSKAAKQKQSAEWVAKFNAYLAYRGQEGHDPDRVVFVPGTSEPEKFGEARKRYNAFKSFYAEYKKVEFPDGRTFQLEDLADNAAPRRLAEFESSFADRLASVTGDAEKQIHDAMKQLDKDNGWKNDNNIRPPLLDSKWMVSITDSVQRVESALGNDPKAKAVRQQYNALVAKDQVSRKIRAERTLLFPDVYKASDAAELKKMAQEVVSKEKPGSKILRVSLYKTDWSEETVEEWTDTSRTVWRKRTTRKINAQVAGKDASGVFLHTLHLAKDLQSGGWGKLYGNIMWSDPMLESNVDKDGKPM